VLDVEGLEASYHARPVLREISFTVSAGECVAVVGTNGAGKSSLFRALLNLVDMDGAISLHGTPIAGQPTYRIGRQIGYVPQEREIFSTLSVEENIRIAGATSARARELLSKSSVLGDPKIWGRSASALSGGQQQALAILRSVARQPDVLLLDEPLEGLAPIAVDEVIELIAGLRVDSTMAILWAEHSIERLSELCERSLVIQGGELKYDGELNQLQNKERLGQLLGLETTGTTA